MPTSKNSCENLKWWILLLSFHLFCIILLLLLFYQIHYVRQCLGGSRRNLYYLYNRKRKWNVQKKKQKEENKATLDNAKRKERKKKNNLWGMKMSEIKLLLPGHVQRIMTQFIALCIEFHYKYKDIIKKTISSLYWSAFLLSNIMSICCTNVFNTLLFLCFFMAFNTQALYSLCSNSKVITTNETKKNQWSGL